VAVVVEEMLVWKVAAQSGVDVVVFIIFIVTAALFFCVE
jgi:hypothetical protein